MSSDVADFIFRKQITSRLNGNREKKNSSETCSNGPVNKFEVPQIISDKYVENYRKGRDYSEINSELQEFRRILENQRNSSSEKKAQGRGNDMCTSPGKFVCTNGTSPKLILESIERRVGKLRMSNEGENFYKNSENSISFMTENSRIFFETDLPPGEKQAKLSIAIKDSQGKSIVLANPDEINDEPEILETARFRPEQEKIEWPNSTPIEESSIQKGLGKPALVKIDNQSSLKTFLEQLPKVNVNGLRTLLKCKSSLSPNLLGETEAARARVCQLNGENEINKKNLQKNVQIKSKMLKKLLGENGKIKKNIDKDSKMVLSIMDSDILSTNDDSATKSNKKQTNISISIEEELELSTSDADETRTLIRTKQAFQEIFGKIDILKNLSILNEREKKLLEQASKVVELKRESKIESLKNSAFVCELCLLEDTRDHQSMLQSNLFRDLFSILNGVKITRSFIDPPIFSVFLGSSFVFLNLSCNNIKSELSLFQNCQNLEFINLSFNRIDSLSLLSSCKKLKEIHISNNIIEGMGGLTNLQQLNLLDISNNMIGNYEALALLSCNKKLDLLNLKGNPISKLPNYRKSIQVILPQLKGLDLTDYTSLSDFTNFQDYAFNNASELKIFHSEPSKKNEKERAGKGREEKTVVKSSRSAKEECQSYAGKGEKEASVREGVNESLFFVPKGKSGSAFKCPKVFLRLKNITGSISNGQPEGKNPVINFSKKECFERDRNHSAERHDSVESRTVRKNQGVKMGICISQGSLTARDNFSSGVSGMTQKKKPDNRSCPRNIEIRDFTALVSHGASKQAVHLQKGKRGPQN